jgi:hypothetical protein
VRQRPRTCCARLTLPRGEASVSGGQGGLPHSPHSRGGRRVSCGPRVCLCWGRHLLVVMRPSSLRLLGCRRRGGARGVPARRAALAMEKSERPNDADRRRRRNEKEPLDTLQHLLLLKNVEHHADEGENRVGAGNEGVVVSEGVGSGVMGAPRRPRTKMIARGRARGSRAAVTPQRSLWHARQGGLCRLRLKRVGARVCEMYSECVGCGESKSPLSSPLSPTPRPPFTSPAGHPPLRPLPRRAPPAAFRPWPSGAAPTRSAR